MWNAPPTRGSTLVSGAKKAVKPCRVVHGSHNWAGEAVTTTSLSMARSAAVAGSADIAAVAASSADKRRMGFIRGSREIVQNGAPRRRDHARHRIPRLLMICAKNDHENHLGDGTS